jgi:Effector Associated Constant Component 1
VGVAIIVTLEGVETDEMRQLRTWLLAEAEMRGRVELIERPPDSDRLGSVLEALRIIVEPGSAVLASALVTWLKQRRSSIRATVAGEDGTKLSIEADKIRLMDAHALGEFTDQMVRLTTPARPLPPSDDSPG